MTTTAQPTLTRRYRAPDGSVTEVIVTPDNPFPAEADALDAQVRVGMLEDITPGVWPDDLLAFIDAMLVHMGWSPEELARFRARMAGGAA